VELLNEVNLSDPISQILRRVRISGTVYCRSLLGAPWGFGVEAHGNPAFHVATAGDCWLEVEGEPDQIALATGDLVLLPTGCRHWLRDHPASPTTELETILANTPPDEHRRLHYGGHGARTALLCGGFALDGAAAHPILSLLPSVLHIRGDAERPVPGLAALALLTAESAASGPGADEVVNRLAEALLTQALRIALTDLQAADGAGVLALRDPKIATAIDLIHRQPERAWTVEIAAAEVALSRSAFAARFRELVGESPKRYITRTRLAHGAALLHHTDAPLAEIATRAGYATEYSFGKAFKRTFGIAPGIYRGNPNFSPRTQPTRDHR
jgi:AraC-like DNA-binding protein